MRRFLSSSVSLLFVFSLAVVLCASVTASPAPIQLERRELSPFNDIVSELKTKTMGGRMRFGKRSSSDFQYYPFWAEEAEN